ncbi:MAG: hypothetical protein ABEJ36_01930 [Candidatus Nanosalina sp.]
MSTRSFQGNIPVSTAKHVFRGLELGRDDFVKQAVVDDGIPIERGGEAPGRSNSTILFGKFPEEAAVKGLVHDATVNLYRKELGFRELREPEKEDINRILEGGIKGTRDATHELKHSISNLEKKYGIAPDQLLDYRFSSGETVSDLLGKVGEYRHGTWREDTAGFERVDAEKSEFENGLSARMDLLYRGAGKSSDQIREVKMKDETSIYDEFQASAYWLVNGDENAELVVEYPLIDERLEFNPEKEENDFDPREYAFDIINSRDRAIENIEDLRELQKEYFDEYGSETEERREKATREALRELEVW